MFCGAMKSPLFAALLLLSAQTPPPSAKRMPPAGIAIPDADRAALTAGAAALGQEIASLRTALAARPPLLARLPDVEVFHKAVDWALRYDEVFDVKQVAFAKTLLQQGTGRAQQLRAGKAPWLDATGLIVRGYRSQIDGSVQPYGLVVPATFKRGDTEPRRLDVWLAGRNDKRTELAFIAERMKGPGEFAAADAIVLHPYGRFCNATKFAGEQDVFESMAAVKRDYPTDPLRTVVWGFSMGGASAWHLTTHHPGLWCAASPGAGFAETQIYTKAYDEKKEPRPWWEQVLWRWYNATDCAGNLFNVPTIAYSGELDPQKQSADLMEKAMAAEGLKLERIIGPNTAHKYEPTAKKELAARIDALAATGRAAMPPELRFTTYTLRYPECAWVRVTGMEKHWERADIRARRAADGSVQVETRNISALTLRLPGLVTAVIDGQRLIFPQSSPASEQSLRKTAGKWSAGTPDAGKRPGLQGPIDDAFMDAFLFVRPTGKPLNDKVGAWAAGELTHAVKMWRDIFRGDAPVKDDTALTGADIAASNLVLWGDPSSNKVLAKLLPQLPLKWDGKTLEFRGYKLDAAHHAPILILPNPLNPRRYIVLNSGMDFRDEAYGTNALQVAKLPDWAIIDLRTPPGPRWPGLVYDAGFFDEQWK